MRILSYLVVTKDVMGLQNRGKGRRRRFRNLPAAVFVVLFPPLGIFLTWRSSWSGLVKCCMTGVAVAVLLLGVSLLPSADNRVNGGIELVGSDRAVDVYGPELPTAMVTGYTVNSTGSVLAPIEESEVEYVYAASGAECYHTYECKFAYASSLKLTVYEAHFLGYKPCGRCNPPVYSPET